MPEYVVGTYNMSWASDSAKFNRNFASEFYFLNQNTSLGSPNLVHLDDTSKECLDKDKKPACVSNTREFWTNALSHLKTFIIEKEPCMVGLQEINKPELDAIRESQVLTGISALEDMLSQINNKYKIVYAKRTYNAHDSITPIIYDVDRLGGFEHESSMVEIKDKVFGTDDDIPIGFYTENEFLYDIYLNTPPCSTKDTRPCYAIITDTGNLLINIHGYQCPKKGKSKPDFDAELIKYIDVLKVKIEEWVGDKKSKIKNIIITGDFNDRYDGLSEIELLGRKLKYTGEAPKSCCYNWDSSCDDGTIDGKYKRTSVIEVDKSKPTNDYYTCDVTPPTSKDIKDTEDRLSNLGNNGLIKNYQYRGDKIFGNVGTDDTYGKLQIFEYDTRQGKISRESDHELVFGSFMFNDTPIASSDTTGGKKKTKSRKRKYKKNRKQSRRNKRRSNKCCR